jgi:phosphocarrier protein HPr
MITKEYIITAAEGLHARPATNLIRLAKTFKSVTKLKNGDRVIKLNSMLNLLSMGLKGGDDEQDAGEAINKFFNEELKHL